MGRDELARAALEERAPLGGTASGFSRYSSSSALRSRRSGRRRRACSRLCCTNGIPPAGSEKRVLGDDRDRHADMKQARRRRPRTPPAAGAGRSSRPRAAPGSAPRDQPGGPVRERRRGWRRSRATARRPATVVGRPLRAPDGRSPLRGRPASPGRSGAAGQRLGRRRRAAPRRPRLELGGLRRAGAPAPAARGSALTAQYTTRQR